MSQLTEQSRAETGDPVAPNPGGVVPCRLRRRILAPLAGCLLIVHALATLLLVRSNTAHLEQDAASLADEIGARLDDHERMNIVAMRGMLRAVSERTEVREAFLAGDRESAEGLLRGLYAEAERICGITHFYIHGPDAINFLRVHQPEESGGPVDRWTYQQAARTGEFASGYEPGKLSTFTLRCVLPWTHEGPGIGFLEMGKEFDRIAAEFGEPIMLVVPKADLDEQRYRDAEARLGVPDTWDRFPEVVVPYGLPKGFPPPLLSRMQERDTPWASVVDSERRMPNGPDAQRRPRSELIEHESRTVQVASMPLHDSTDGIENLLASRCDRFLEARSADGVLEQRRAAGHHRERSRRRIRIAGPHRKDAGPPGRRAGGGERTAARGAGGIADQRAPVAGTHRFVLRVHRYV
jgi:hypothetical protein